MSRLGSLRLVATLALVSTGIAVGCSSDDDGTKKPGQSAAGGQGAGSSAGGDLTIGVGGNDEFQACATGIVEGDRIPVQMLIMFDQSGSMLLNQKWTDASTALIAFFQDKNTAGLRVALRFFPDDAPTPGCDETTCSVDACATPLVAVGELNAQPAYADPQQKKLVDAVNSHGPDQNALTPMYAALGGAEKWAKSHAAADLKTVVVLVTDGAPKGCNEDGAAIAALAKDGNDSAGVITYALGMEGANMALLDAIANAGGTGKALAVQAGSVHTDLIAALRNVGRAPLRCSMPLPDATSSSQELDPNLVNVSHRPSDGSGPNTIAQVADAAGCASAGGWYYLPDGDAPTTIELCPSTCSEVQADLGSELNIVLGCATVTSDAK